MDSNNCVQDIIESYERRESSVETIPNVDLGDNDQSVFDSSQSSENLSQSNNHLEIPNREEFRNSLTDERKLFHLNILNCVYNKMDMDEVKEINFWYNFKLKNKVNEEYKDAYQLRILFFKTILGNIDLYKDVLSEYQFKYFTSHHHLIYLPNQLLMPIDCKEIKYITDPNLLLQERKNDEFKIIITSERTLNTTNTYDVFEMPLSLKLYCLSFLLTENEKNKYVLISNEELRKRLDDYLKTKPIPSPAEYNEKTKKEIFNYYYIATKRECLRESNVIFDDKISNMSSDDTLGPNISSIQSFHSTSGTSTFSESLTSFLDVNQKKPKRLIKRRDRSILNKMKRDILGKPKRRYKKVQIFQSTPRHK